MQGGGKDFGRFTTEEQLDKVKQLGALIADHGLQGQVKAKLFDQVVCPLKAPEVQRQMALFIEGKAALSDKPKVDAFKKAARPLLAGINPRTMKMEISCGVKVGDPYLEITDVVDVWTEDEKNITHKQGQVLLIDFWATWCPPCQAPMAHNQHMLEQHGARWGDKVRIVGISIDDGTAAVQKHVKAKKWEKIEHLHRGGSSGGDDYGMQGVPHVILVDTQGKVVYIGHPMGRNLEQDIETLVKGEALKGVKAGGDDDEEDDASHFKQVDI